ncbi:MAG TPA: GerMN domain-containing protein [Candidatus Dojkabacteria bacterium]|nr:GerMN domain-containing protein [Candidatus Dojkabacteria bacterium]
MKVKQLKAQALSILVVLLVIIFVLLAIIAYLVYQNTKNNNTTSNTKNITTYKECADAGYPILESFPSRCMTPDGRSFTNPDEHLNENPTTQTIKVYFPKSTVDDPSKVFALNRDIVGLDAGTIENASIEQIIAGPTEDEQMLYYYTPIILSGASNCSSLDFTLTIQSKKATVKFCKDLKLAGELSDARVITSITKTLKQFSTITSVVVLDKNGNCVGDLSGLNNCLK